MSNHRIFPDRRASWEWSPSIDMRPHPIAMMRTASPMARRITGGSFMLVEYAISARPIQKVIIGTTMLSVMRPTTRRARVKNSLPRGDQSTILEL